MAPSPAENSQTMEEEGKSYGGMVPTLLLLLPFFLLHILILIIILISPHQ